MERLLSGASVRKPAGGVAEVVLTPASNVGDVRFDDFGGRCRISGFADPTRCLRPPLVEGRSSYEEQMQGSAGAPLVSHTLTLALDPHDAAALRNDPTTEAIRNEGAVAQVRTESGRRLCVGCSSRFGTEQPLRLLGTDYASGCGLCDRPLTLLRLHSADTAPAAELEEQETQPDTTENRP